MQMTNSQTNIQNIWLQNW